MSLWIVKIFLLSLRQLGSLCLSVLYRHQFIKFPMQISPFLAPNIHHLNCFRDSSSFSFNLRSPGRFQCFFSFRHWCLHFLVSSNVLIYSMYVIYFLKIFFVFTLTHICTFPSIILRNNFYIYHFIDILGASEVGFVVF